jgi:preprotein translocase subunit SecY
MFGIPQEAFLLGQGPLFFFTGTIILVTGCIFAMWLGEKITDKGIGNGISLLITVGIIATMPQSFIQEYAARVTGSNGGLMMILIELVIWWLIILASVYLVMAVRRIAVQYARRTASGSYEKNISGSRQFLPLKLNASGVMPIIFAQV